MNTVQELSLLTFEHPFDGQLYVVFACLELIVSLVGWICWINLSNGPQFFFIIQIHFSSASVHFLQFTVLSFEFSPVFSNSQINSTPTP